MFWSWFWDGKTMLVRKVENFVYSILHLIWIGASVSRNRSRPLIIIIIIAIILKRARHSFSLLCTEIVVSLLWANNYGYPRGRCSSVSKHHSWNSVKVKICLKEIVSNIRLVYICIYHFEFIKLVSIFNCSKLFMHWTCLV